VIPYRVRFDFHVLGVEEPALMTGRAQGGLQGTGTWRLFEEGGACAVTFEWEVSASSGWMRAAGPVAGPLFRAGHDRIMRDGGKGLAALLEVPLLAAG
jgi:hypothetical protein